MPHTRRTPARKTTDLTLNPEDWMPVATWLQQSTLAGVPDHRLYLDTESETAVQRTTARSERTPHNQQIGIRLPNELADALAQQTRFWEACLDELPPEARNNAPDPATFLELALDIEMSIEESAQPKPTSANRLTCTVCHRPATPDGTAAVDTVEKRIGVAYKHPQCT